MVYNYLIQMIIVRTFLTLILLEQYKLSDTNYFNNIPRVTQYSVFEYSKLIHACGIEKNSIISIIYGFSSM